MDTVFTLLISYTKIRLKEDTMQYKVLIINKILTFKKEAYNSSNSSIFTTKPILMALSPSKINTFLFFKLPAAFWCGVRVVAITHTHCTTSVRHRWINQNPFRSMYFAVQAMAAELTTGALVMQEIKKSGHNISMLVAHNKAVFTKKATGRITFTCSNGQLIAETIQKAITTGQGQTCWMQSVGKDQKGEQVSEFHFEWTVRVK